MGQFRISFGSASCRHGSEGSAFNKSICSLIYEKINYLKSLSKNQLEKWQTAETTILNINNKEVVLTIFQITLEEKRLIVVQSFYSTWKSPNYFSLNKVGKILSEGFFIKDDDTISDANDEDLWPYR